MITENLGNRHNIQQQTTIWPFISTLKEQAEVDDIFSKIKIYMWEHTELYSHRFKCIYFVSNIRTRVCPARLSKYYN